MERGGCIYIMTNKRHTVLYTGVTSNLVSRIWEHKNKVHPGSFTAKYNCDKLVYYRMFSTIEEAIAAEKAIKGGSRFGKLRLIDVFNLTWKDLYEDIVDQ
jgi:putative endonuclease